MLTPETIAIVKSTAPVLAEHGELLTRHFYTRMFTHNPEVLPFFNPTNQHKGSQQRALAGAIAAYAANIDNLGVLMGAVELIAQKHASLMIKPEHYPIVGANLLASIREVLGTAATDDIINAWAQAYGFLADILTKREAEIYADNSEAAGGWEGFRKFRLIRKETESLNIVSLYLQPADGLQLKTFKPGQYVTVRVTLPNGMTTMRNYSLSDKPGMDWYRISVKREKATVQSAPDGYVSNHLHDHFHIGDEVEIAPPCGEFCLDASKADKPLVLMAGGVGITPLISILKNALELDPQREILFIHACVDEEMQAFRQKLHSIEATHPNVRVHSRYSDRDHGTDDTKSFGLLSEEFLDAQISNRGADFYFCGPKPFMQIVYGVLKNWNIPTDQVHFEFFGPVQDLEAQPLSNAA
ncbi:NO-inducible flavohemoprotein [Rhizobium sp. KVB221]|uniref:Flavohemoprotein n=1 Tax=Rhizobium setariae TaxID=2801340 RepID=A0A936YKX8_9HYPH|nr:NO-inducible flavohemoprotein [Rhizobium setariae]MBL0372250.1 NO-inducible flavohemoprotein [Rhizobium setariae]